MYQTVDLSCRLLLECLLFDLPERHPDSIVLLHVMVLTHKHIC